MNTDDRLQQYFHARSAEIPLSATPTAAIAARGRRRRTRRRAARVGGALGAFALAGATAVAMTGRATPEPVTAAQQPVLPSSLRWELVADVPEALTFAADSVVGPDGALYAVSTSPAGSDEAVKQRSALYRSEDGRAWSGIDPAGGFQPSGLAAGPDRVYAVGTSPSGGGTTAQVAALGGDAPSVRDLPLDLDGLEAETGRAQRVRHLAVETSGNAVVALVRVGPADWPEDVVGPDRALVDLRADGAWSADLGCWDRGAGDTPVSTQAPAGGDAEARAAAGDAGGSCPTRKQGWSELGLTEAEVRGVVGETYVFTSTGGGAFELTERLPGPAETALEAGDDGFWLVQGGAPATEAAPAEPATVRHTADGRSWQPVAVPALSSEVAASAAGDLAGRAVFELGDAPQGPRFWIADAAGGRVVDLSSTLGDRTILQYAFGPLGFVAVTQAAPPAGEDAPSPDHAVLRSGDLRSFEREALPAGGRRSPVGLSVTADAVIVRIGDRTGLAPDDDTTPSRIDLFVGTPA